MVSVGKMKHLACISLFATALLGCSTNNSVVSGSPSWIGTWGAAPDSSALDPSFANTAYMGTNTYQNQTLRLIAHISIGGSSFRLRLSNELGSAPITVASVHMALQSTANQTVIGTDVPVLFSNSAAVTIPAEGAAISDAIPFSAAASSNIAVSIYLSSATLQTTHVGAEQNNYVSPFNSGDQTSSVNMPLDTKYGTIGGWPLLTAIDVQSGGSGAIVAFGASATDGQGSTIGANHRWANILSNRLQANNSTYSVVDEGLAGNRLLTDTYGESGLLRFSRDAEGTSGVRYIILTDLPLNDIGDSSSTPLTEGLVPNIIAGYQELISQAHTRGLKVIGCTLLPIGGSIFDTPDDESKRATINTWIQTSGSFDGLIDFNAAVADPNSNTNLLPAYDSGDHLHPNDAGYAAMGAAINLSLFSK
jgi:lysophospholipase L1-like esterase